MEATMTTDLIETGVPVQPVRTDHLQEMLARHRPGRAKLALAAFSILALAIAIVYTIGGTR